MKDKEVIKNFKKLKGKTYNLGLSSANLTKLALAKKIKSKIKDLKIQIIKNKNKRKKQYNRINFLTIFKF